MSRSVLRIKGTLLLRQDRFSLQKAAGIIKEGGLVAFPTETVYGLGAAATDEKAVNRIYQAKGRPVDNPMIVHISSSGQLNIVARYVPELAYKLTDRFWPGPLSLVLPRADIIPAAVCAGLPTIAVRMPDHRIALEFIHASGVPIAAPSANRSGKPSPTSFRHVLDDLAGKIDAVIKSEACSVGVESTVLDLTGSGPVILRPGGIPREELEEALGQKVPVSGGIGSAGRPISPGMKYRHYSPRAPLILITGPKQRRSLLLKAIAGYYQEKGLKVGSLGDYINKTAPLKGNKTEYMAAHLYHALRQLDHHGVDLILAEETDIAGIGLAVMNRLRKAATRILKV